MNVVVCGAGGMLATDVIEVLNHKGYRLTALDINDLDITNLYKVRKTLQQLQPDLIVNAAAYTNVDECESQPDLAYRVNCLGPRNLAIAAEEIGAAVVHISTDYVFGGAGDTPFREYDPVNPMSVYGKSKLDGEIAVRQSCRRHYIVRTSWLFGVHGNNFVRTMLRLAGEKEVVAVVNDQLGSPTYTCDLADAIASLIETAAYGTYHITNSEACTWFEFVKEIFRQAGVERVKVEPISTEQLNRPANRPRYSVLDNYMWKMDGHAPLRSYKEALNDYLSKEKDNNKKG